MTFLVIGGTGFIGSRAVERLRAAGEEVVVTHRGRSAPPATPGVRWAVAQRGDTETLLQLVAEHRVRTVVDMIAATVGTTRPLLDALDGRIDRYVLISSADVYRNYGGLIELEAATPATRPLAEDDPLRTVLHPYRRDAPDAPEAQRRFLEEYDKIPIEEAVRGASGFAGTVVRLPMVYGPGDWQRRFAARIWRLKEGLPDPADQARAAWRTSYGYVTDVGEGIALAARHPKAAGRTYNIARPEAPTDGEWVGKLAALLGVPAQAPRADPPPAEEGGRFDPRFHLVLDSSRIRSELGYREVVEEDEGLRATIADEIARGRPPGLESG
jgi:nucleoside-diphosphate-sugar epimerase